MAQPPSAKLGVVIVDDEPPGLDNLRALIARHADLEIIAECSSGRDALKTIALTKPELVLLDVQMPECDGFDVVEQLGANLPRALIYVTAYDQYAVRAFEAGAIDYLLKPFDTKRFDLALSRARERISWIDRSPGLAQRWVVKSAGQAVFIKLADIDWIESADYYVCLHVAGRDHLLRRSMADVAEEIEKSHFCRIHRSAIVNLERVTKLETGADGESVVVLANHVRLPVSRRFRRHFQDRMAGGDALVP